MLKMVITFGKFAKNVGQYQKILMSEILRIEEKTFKKFW